MAAGIVEIDLHGKNKYQAEVAIEAALRRSGAGTYRLCLVHGHNSGTELRDMVRSQYAKHPRVLRLETRNPGVTELVLREF